MSAAFDTYSVLRDAIENPFADNARLHDKLIHASLAAFQGKNGKDEGLRLSRLSTALEYIMRTDHPIASDTWFGREEDRR